MAEARCWPLTHKRMISHLKKYIFVHIPKTGGTSIEARLLQEEGVEINDSNFPLSKLTLDQQRKYRVGKNSRQHWPLGRFPYRYQRRYFCFTFVRNPWDLMVSEFLYVSRIEGLQSLDRDEVSSSDFQDRFKRFIRSGKGDRYHLRPQYRFINRRMDFIGRFENLQKDFEAVSERVGLPLVKLPHRNRSIRGHYSDYFDDESRALVSKKFRKDIELFDFSFCE